LLHQIQQKLYDEARFIPVWELGFRCASGPRVAVSGMGLIPTFAYSGPYEDVQLKFRAGLSPIKLIRIHLVSRVSMGARIRSDKACG
jgi:hypothetical protein